MPRWMTLGLVLLAAILLVPFACIARARHGLSDKPRIHIIQDMDNQPRFKAQQENPLFADGRASRPPVAGTVARGRLEADDFFYRGVSGADWAAGFPLPLTEALMQRGRERYDVFCSPCHGLSGYGDGIVARRADRLQEGTWTPPSSLHTELVRSRPEGHLYNTIANGIRNMPGYAAQIPEEDRWAIVAYVRALQRSQHAEMEDVPAELQSKLR
jgi:mono/diheme cytochrome c family protein